MAAGAHGARRVRRPAPFRVPLGYGSAPKPIETGWSNSDVGTFRARATPDSPDYKPKVAEPVMQAIDELPAEYRALIHEFDYVDVYRAWKRGWSTGEIRVAARDGTFHLG